MIHTTHKNYTERLIHCFPAELKNDVLKVIEILPLEENSIKLTDGNMHFVGDLIHESTYTVSLNGETLIIPYRLYFNEPTSESETSLSKMQHAILNCIYLRHHNGYLRQKRLEKLRTNFEYFVVPFSLQLLGEQVIQILETLNTQINQSNIEAYRAFIRENPLFWRSTQKRMVSYWNTYYRYPENKKLKQYIGTLIVKKITANVQQH